MFVEAFVSCLPGVGFVAFILGVFEERSLAPNKIRQTLTAFSGRTVGGVGVAEPPQRLLQKRVRRGESFFRALAIERPNENGVCFQIRLILHAVIMAWKPGQSIR